MKKFFMIGLVTSTILLGSTTELKTHTELSYVNTKGNSDTESFALEAKADKSIDRHALNIKAEAFYSKDGDIESKNKIVTELSYDYALTERFNLNYFLGFKQDKFSSFDSQLYTGPGTKYKAINLELHKLNLQANILYASDDLKAPNATENYISWQTALNYNWQILDNLKFIQEISHRSSFEESENYFTTSKTSISNKISNTLSLGLSYKLDYANKVSTGIERIDKTFLTSLIIDY